MPDNQLPSDFDWVSARHRCSEAMVFERLQLAVKANCKKRNDLNAERNERWPVEVVSDGGVCTVRKRTFGGRSTAITFGPTDNGAIHFQGDGDEEFDGTPFLADNGECKLMVDGIALAEWQVLSRALDKLFFGKVVNPSFFTE